MARIGVWVPFSNAESAAEAAVAIGRKTGFSGEVLRLRDRTGPSVAARLATAEGRIVLMGARMAQFEGIAAEGDAGILERLDALEADILDHRTRIGDLEREPAPVRPEADDESPISEAARNGPPEWCRDLVPPEPSEPADPDRLAKVGQEPTDEELFEKAQAIWNVTGGLDESLRAISSALYSLGREHERNSLSLPGGRTVVSEWEGALSALAILPASDGATLPERVKSLLARANEAESGLRKLAAQVGHALALSCLSEGEEPLEIGDSAIEKLVWEMTHNLNNYRAASPFDERNLAKSAALLARAEKAERELANIPAELSMLRGIDDRMMSMGRSYDWLREHAREIGDAIKPCGMAGTSLADQVRSLVADWQRRGEELEALRAAMPRRTAEEERADVVAMLDEQERGGRMTTMSDRDVIAWARDWADQLAGARQFTQEERYRRLAGLAEKGAEGWLPIASAPLDGSEVLFVVHGEVYQGRWDKREKMWRSARGLLFGIVTHWRPLPAPPGADQ